MLQLHTWLAVQDSESSVAAATSPFVGFLDAQAATGTRRLLNLKARLLAISFLLLGR